MINERHKQKPLPVYGKKGENIFIGFVEDHARAYR